MKMEEMDNREAPNSKCTEDWCIFNGYRFPLLSCMCYMMVGIPEKRTLFIFDEDENYIISFEQGMECLDQYSAEGETRISICGEYRVDNKYLHQKKRMASDEKRKDWIGFHMEVTDDNGLVHNCPGQMTVSPSVRSEEEVEPILIELLKGLEVWKG